MTVPAALTDEEIGILTEVLSLRPFWSDVAHALEGVANERGSEGLRLLSFAFVYELVRPGHDERRA